MFSDLASSLAAVLPTQSTTYRISQKFGHITSLNAFY